MFVARQNTGVLSSSPLDALTMVTASTRRCTPNYRRTGGGARHMSARRPRESAATLYLEGRVLEHRASWCRCR